jgi:2-oxoglutarate ferredoxin oxidoreductase subunit delta
MKGRVVVNRELCKGCSLCVSFCPRDVLELADEVNSKGYKVASSSHPDNCTGCAICALVCPDIAIMVWQSKSSKEAI